MNAGSGPMAPAVDAGRSPATPLWGLEGSPGRRAQAFSNGPLMAAANAPVAAVCSNPRRLSRLESRCAACPEGPARPTFLSSHIPALYACEGRANVGARKMGSKLRRRQPERWWQDPRVRQRGVDERQDPATIKDHGYEVGRSP